MFTFFGVVLILLGLVMLIVRPMLNKEDKYKTKTDGRGNETRVLVSKKSHPFLLGFSKKMSTIVIAIGIFLIIIPGIFFYALPGKAYAVFYPWGSQKAVLQQGINTKWWGKIIDFQMEISVKDILEEDMATYDKIENVYFQMAVEREFSDAVKGEVANSIVIGINLNDPDEFLLMAKKNRSERNLVYSRIIPYRDAVIKNTAKLMSAQEYIAGASAEFDRAFKDQMENGMYILEEVEDNRKTDIIGDMDQVRTIDDNNAKRKVYKIKTRKVNGVDEPLRNEGSLVKEYGLTVIQAVVNIIDWEDRFDDRLDKQKEQVAETQLERQMTERAIIKTQRVYQEGEANKAEERARLEKEQIQRTIAAETKVKEEQFNLQAERILLEKSKVEAQSRRILADVKKYEIEKADGLSERAKYVIDQDVAKGVGVAEHLKNTKFPQFMYFGGGKEGTTQMPIIYDLLGAKLAESMFAPVDKK